MNTAAIALALYWAYLAIAFGLRTWLLYRRTDLLTLGTDTSLIDDALREAAQFGKITDPQRLRADLTAAPARLRDDAGVLLDSLNEALAPNSEAALHG